MKRASSSETALAPEAKKRKVVYTTFSKWKVDMDKECQTVTWLEYSQYLHHIDLRMSNFTFIIKVIQLS